MPLASASRSATVRTPSRSQQGRRQRRHVMDVAAALFIACAVAWAVGLIVFMRAIPEAVEDSESRTDAIVVLTGGAERLATGLKLLEADKASAVLVSGVNPQVGVRDVLRAAGTGKADALLARVAAGHGARDTAGNAAEAAQWMRHHGFRSLRLVTASYHMPRSRFEFARLRVREGLARRSRHPSSGVPAAGDKALVVARPEDPRTDRW
ncbi:MAG: YdcF family protein [Rhodospirillales bacterium]|nr:YdcF family protein [Rhodospirillales bacterium]